jgi:hypothetical protein
LVDVGVQWQRASGSALLHWLLLSRSGAFWAPSRDADEWISRGVVIVVFIVVFSTREGMSDATGKSRQEETGATD